MNLSTKNKPLALFFSTEQRWNIVHCTLGLILFIIAAPATSLVAVNL